MKILFPSSEGVPYCKTGGLADVAGALSAELAKKGHTVRLVLPYYRSIREKFSSIRPLSRGGEVRVGDRAEPFNILEAGTGRLKIWFINAPGYFDRPGLYGPVPGTDFADNAERFSFFSRAVLEAARLMKFKPDIVHGHDWQTGLIPAYLRLLHGNDPLFMNTATVFTIHNMAYQGNFSPSVLGMTGLPSSAFHWQGLEFYGQLSYLKAALVYADAVNTVSPTYAREIRSDANFGRGLEGVLADRGDRFIGIANGLDMKVWDPATDSFLIKNFKLGKMTGRADCKRDLQGAVGFTVNPNVPLLGFIGRLDPQKGVDVLVEILPFLLKEGVQMVFLGQGHPDYTAAVRSHQERYPTQIFFETAFSESLAHKIYAGSDLFLMPSRYEPCGLGQLIGMRYGAVPVVSPTGGLVDTVSSVDEAGATGFVAPGMSPGAFLSAVTEALHWFKDKKRWATLQENGMGADHSWAHSVNEYQRLYKNAIKWRRGVRA